MDTLTTSSGSHNVHSSLFGSTSPASFSTISTNGSYSTSDSTMKAGSITTNDRSAYFPSYFIPLLEFSQPTTAANTPRSRSGSDNGTTVVDEKAIRAMSNENEMLKYFQTITVGLNSGEDWNARISALLLLQRLSWGYNTEYMTYSHSDSSYTSSLMAGGWKAPLVDVCFFVQNVKDIHDKVSNFINVC